MADGTHIEWTDATWNPITGCSVVSPGCTNCYAMKLAGGRLRHHPTRAGLTTQTKAGPVWTGEVRFNAEVLDQPLRWRRARRIFVCAHGDLFHESVPDAWIDQVFAVMALAPQHTFQVLTKRAVRMRAYFDDLYLPNGHGSGRLAMTEVSHASGRRKLIELRDWTFMRQPLPNLWLGVSAEDQPRAEDRVRKLLHTHAAKRFVSVEPMIARVDLCAAGMKLNGLLDASTGERRFLDSVIVGGESGPGARPMHPDWARQIRDDCAACGVPFHFKQWGTWGPDNGEGGLKSMDRLLRASTAHRQGDQWSFDLHAADPNRRFDADLYSVGKKAAGRLLDGVEHNGGPW